jgi:hypothetical protein
VEKTPEDLAAESASQTSAVSPVVEIEDAPVSSKNKRAGSRRPSAIESDEEESAPSVSGLSDEEIVKSLRKAIYDGETDGFDFVKLMKMLKKNAALDEGTRYSTAISAADAMGVSSTDLVASGQDALKLLSTASKQFDADLAEMEEQNSTNQKELEAVEAEIESLTAKQKSLSKKISTGTETVEEQRKGFDASLETVSDEVKAIIANIKKYSK